METTILKTSGYQPVPALVPQTIHKVEVLPMIQATPEQRIAPANLPFIEANTLAVELSHLKDDCIVPVFARDNELTISHQNFIETVQEAASKVFPNESIGEPQIRVSHPIKGRIPEAIHKPANQLLESEKTLFYERMMFIIELPTLYQDIDGCRLNLTVGGVRSFHEQNLYARKSPERFKIFIGFRNMVCCNLCVSTDGYKSSLRVMDTVAMLSSAEELFRSYDMERHLALMRAFQGVGMSESQFAQFLGKCRLYQYLPAKEKKLLPEILLTDTQIGLVAKAYYDDHDFGKGSDRTIDLWKVYNLFTGANKSSYIDNFLDRANNATDLTTGLARALQGDAQYSWFLC